MATTTTDRPLRSSGVYHAAMPEQTVRGVPLPSSSVSLSSFFAFSIGSQSTTFATRRSIFAKSSIPISSRNAMFFGSSASAAFCAASRSASTSARIAASSSRANRGDGVPTENASAAPNTAASKPVSPASTCSCAAIASAVSGVKGLSRMPSTRMLSSRLYSTAFSRGLSSSDFARIHGVVSSIYLLQRRARSKIASAASALW